VIIVHVPHCSRGEFEVPRIIAGKLAEDFKFESRPGIMELLVSLDSEAHILLRRNSE
jgi:hypothetical protein